MTGVVATDAVAICGSFVFLELLRSDGSRALKLSLAIPAAPLLLFSAFALFYALRRAFAA